MSRPHHIASLFSAASLITGCASLFAASLASPAVAHANRVSADTSIKKEMLIDGVYLFRSPSDLEKWTATNVVVIVNERDVTVFDSNTRPLTARRIIAEIRALTDKPVRTLINSHWHMDHWSGNDEYAKAFPGIQIIATSQTRDYMKRMVPRYFSEQVGVARYRATLDTAVRTGKLRDGSALTADARRKLESDVGEATEFAAEVARIPRVLPNVVYRDTLVFWSGRREFRLISAYGDATASTVMYLPAEKV